MRIDIDNNYTRVVEFASEEEERFLADTLMVPVPGYKYTKAYKDGYWDGNKRFYHHSSKQFLTGFLPMVCETFAASNRKVSLARDLRSPLLVYKNLKGTIAETLRDYQKEEVNSILHNRMTIGEKEIPWVRGVLRHPTGSGKSITSIAIIEQVNSPTLYLVERKRLMHQFAEMYTSLTKNKRIGKIGDGEYSLEDVTVAMVPSLSLKLAEKHPDEELLEYLRDVELVIVDECHHVKEGRYVDIMNFMPDASIHLGLSGTPLSRHDLGDFFLLGVAGDILSDLDRTSLEEDGFLAPVHVKMLECSTKKVLMAKYAEAYQKLIVTNPSRNEMIVNAIRHECVKNKAKVLVLVRYLDHGYRLSEVLSTLENEGIRVAYLHGTIPSSQQKSVIQSFESENGINVIVATAIFDEGVDLPAANVLVYAAAGKSEIKTIQRVGRIVRPKKRGASVRVYDFWDMDNEYLYKHSVQRRNTYKDQKFVLVGDHTGG